MTTRRSFLSFLIGAPAVGVASSLPVAAVTAEKPFSLQEAFNVWMSRKNWDAIDAADVAAFPAAEEWTEDETGGQIFRLIEGDRNEFEYKRLAFYDRAEFFEKNERGYWQRARHVQTDYDKIESDPNAYWKESHGIEPADSWRTKRAKYLRAQRRDRREINAAIRRDLLEGRSYMDHASSYGEQVALDWLNAERVSRDWFLSIGHR